MNTGTCSICGEAKSGFRPLCEIDGALVIACNSCGHQSLYPVPTEEELKRLYGEGYHDFWGIKEDFRRVFNLKLKTSKWLLSRAEKFLPGPIRGLRHLDIGCAFGYMLEAGRSMGFESYGVDVSAAAHAAADMGYNVRRAALEDSGFPNGNFDMVTAVDVIEHIPELKRWLKECGRVLKGGGLLVLVTPDCGSLAARLMKCRWPHYKAEHLHYYSARTLEKLLTEAGIAVISKRVCIKYLTPAYIASHYGKFRRRSLEGMGMGMLRSLLPEKLLEFPLPLPSEMVVMGRKT